MKSPMVFENAGEPMQWARVEKEINWCGDASQNLFCAVLGLGVGRFLDQPIDYIRCSGVVNRMGDAFRVFFGEGETLLASLCESNLFFGDKEFAPIECILGDEGLDDSEIHDLDPGVNCQVVFFQRAQRFYCSIRYDSRVFGDDSVQARDTWVSICG